MLITRNEKAHWYRYPDATPCHEVPNASKPGEMRPTTKADAKKLGLCPSVTTIDKVVNKPGLNKWLQEGLLLAYASLPRNPGETEDAFIQRVIEDADKQREDAAQFGTGVHDAIANHLNGQPYDSKYKPFVESFKTQIQLTEIEQVEKSFATLQYGGRIDCVAQINGIQAILDFKTQEIKNGKLKVYRSWGRQLVAYADALGIFPTHKPINIVFNVKDANEIYVVNWTKYRDELLAEWKHVMAIWYGENWSEMKPEVKAVKA
jgi:hypothetical protein